MFKKLAITHLFFAHCLSAMHQPPESTEEELRSAWGHLQMVLAKSKHQLTEREAMIEQVKAREYIARLKCALPAGRGAEIIKNLEDSDPRKKRDKTNSNMDSTPVTTRAQWNEKGAKQFMQDFVKPGVDINAPMPDMLNRTPLTHALALSEDVECIKRLIALGAGVNVRDGAGNIPLTAAKNGSVENILELLKHNPTIDLTQKKDTSYLMSLVGKNRKIAVLLPELIRCGLHVHVRDENDKTMLICAVDDFKALEATQILVAVKSDVNAQDKKGENALMKLAYLECRPENIVQFAQTLLTPEADVTLTNSNKQTALDILDARVKQLYYPCTAHCPKEIRQFRALLQARMAQQKKAESKTEVAAP